MNRFFPSPAFLLAIVLFAGAVQTDARAQTTYDYEAITAGGSSFSTDRATFNLTTPFIGVKVPGYGSGPSEGYMDTVFGQARTGVVGGLSVQEGYTFRLVSLDVWPSSDSGSNVLPAGESIRVIGKKDGVFVASGDFTTTDLNQNSAPTGGSWQQITITGALATADIDAFEIELLNTQNYMAVDNFNHSDVGPASAAPSFYRGTSATLGVTAGSGAIELEEFLQTLHSETGQILTWSISTGASTGILSGFPTTATASTANPIKVSGVTYTPPALPGSDSFTIQVTDGTASGSIEVTVAAAADVQDGELLVMDSGESKGLHRVDSGTGDRTILSQSSTDFPSSRGVATFNGKIYVADVNIDAIWEVNPSTGARTKISGDGAGSGTTFTGIFNGIAVDEAGSILVPDISARRIFRVDPTTGAREVLAEDALKLNGVDGLAVDYSTGAIYALNQNEASLYVVDPSSGAITLVSGQGTGTGIEFNTIGSGIAVESSGTVLVTDRGADALVRVDPATGNRTTIASFAANPNNANPTAVVVNRDTGAIYVTDSSNNAVLGVSGTGVVTTISQALNTFNLVGSGTGSGVDFTSPDGIALYPNTVVTNAAPVATAPSAPVVIEDGGPVALADDIHITDDDGDDQTVTFTITGGTLEISTTGMTFGGDGNGSASFTASGTLAAVNTALDAATFTPAANVNGVNAGTISFVSNDGTSNSNTASVTFDIAAVNDNPTMTGLPSEITFTEDIGDALDLSAATLSDVDAGSSSITLTLMVSSGVIWGAHALPNDGYGTGTVTQTGSVSALNDFLDTYGWLYYEPEDNVYGDNAAVLEIFVNDKGNSGSGGGGNVALGTVDIHLTGVADRPEITGATTDEDVQTTSGLVVTRSAADGAEVTHFKVTSIVGGTLFLNDGATAVSTGDFITAADGGAGLRFTPTLDRTENGSVTVQASTTADDGGVGGPTATATVTINAVNDAPEVFKVVEFADPSMLEDGSAEFGALNGKFIAVQDVDAGTNDIEVTISAPSSTVSLTSVAGVTFTTGDGSSDETMVFTGTVAEVNDVLTSGITYAPDPDEHGDLGFTISVDDGGASGSGGAKTGSLTLDMPVSPINDAPSFTKGADQELDEDAGAQTVAGWATDIDAGAANESDQELTFDVTNDNNGLFAAQPAVSAGGALTFTPAENAFGLATVTVVLTDDGGDVAPSDDDSDPQTFTITVNSVNDPPVVTVPGTQTTLAGVPLEFSAADATAITVGDVDLGKNVLDVTLTAGSTVQLASTEWLNITGGADGTSMISFSGSPVDINAALDGLIYTPTPGTTTGSLTIAVSDGDDVSTGQIAITITGVNDRPVAADDAATTPEDTPAPINVLANDIDEDGDDLNVVIVTEPADGSVTIDAEGIVTYSPDANFTGQDTFTYIAQDPSLEFASATVTVTVTPVNDAPVALDDAASTTEDAPVTIDVLANDSDIESTLTVTAVGDPANGSASIDPDGNVRYAPEDGFAGTDTFTYTVSDGEIEAGAEVSVTVESTNAQPVATDDAASALHGGSVTIDLLANDTDPDGDVIFVSAVDAPPTGALTDNGDGSITYAPAAGADGDITFTYTISDPDGETDSAVVTITVAGVSSDGDGVADGVEDGAPNGGDGNNDGISDGAQQNVASLPVAAGPNTGKYVTVAAAEGTSLAAVQSTQNPSPDDFPASAVNPAGFLDFQVTGLSAGASTTVWIHLPPGATATGYLKYGPTPDDSTPHWYDFGYDGETGALIVGNRILLFLKDGARGDDDLTANGVIVDPGMPVLGLNSAPVAQPDAATLLEDGSREIDVLANDTDADGETLTVSIVEAPASGSAEITGDGLILYTPPADWFGEMQMTYRVADASGATSDEVIDITVEPVQDAPFAGDDVAVTEEDHSVRIDIFANDVDVDGDAFHLTSQDDPDHGTSVYHYDGSVTYTPGPDFTGTDSWTYTISDGSENSGEIVFGTVTVTVTPVGDAPRFADGNVVDLPADTPVLVAESDAAFTVAVQTATDPDGDLMAYEWHVAADEAFGDVLFTHDVDNTSDMQLAPAAASLIEALEPAGLTTGAELTVFHRVRATDATGAETWSDVQQTTFARSAVSTSNEQSAEQSSGVPDEFRLESNYPNPFNPSTTLAYGLPETAHVTLAVYDITGKRVRLLVEGMRPAGTHRHLVRMDDLPSGVYMYRLVTPAGQFTRMMHLLK